MPSVSLINGAYRFLWVSCSCLSKIGLYFDVKCDTNFGDNFVTKCLALGPSHAFDLASFYRSRSSSIYRHFHWTSNWRFRFRFGKTWRKKTRIDFYKILHLQVTYFGLLYRKRIINLSASLPAKSVWNSEVFSFIIWPQNFWQLETKDANMAAILKNCEYVPINSA